MLSGYSKLRLRPLLAIYQAIYDVPFRDNCKISHGQNTLICQLILAKVITMCIVLNGLGVFS